MTPIKSAIRKSANRTITHVWPVIQEHCGGGDIVSMELSEAPIHAKMDTLAGVDMYQITSRGVTGLAARCQTDSAEWFRKYCTFTVRRCRSREKTIAFDYERDPESQCEFSKRREAIDSNGRFVYPYWTSQAYFDPSGDLDRVAVARTSDIYEMIAKKKYRIQSTRENGGFWTHFFILEWSKLDCFVWERQQPDQVELWI